MSAKNSFSLSKCLENGDIYKGPDFPSDAWKMNATLTSESLPRIYFQTDLSSIKHKSTTLLTMITSLLSLYEETMYWAVDNTRDLSAFFHLLDTLTRLVQLQPSVIKSGCGNLMSDLALLLLSIYTRVPDIEYNTDLFSPSLTLKAWHEMSYYHKRDIKNTSLDRDP